MRAASKETIAKMSIRGAQARGKGQVVKEWLRNGEGCDSVFSTDMVLVVKWQQGVLPL
jgi:hypothetical protein